MSKSIALYELAHQYRELKALEGSDDLPTEVITDTLEALEGDLQTKGANIAMFTRNLDTAADAIEDAAKAMQARAARIRKRAESIRAYLLFHMQAGGIEKIECPEFVIARRLNPEAVVIRENAEVPAEFMVQPDPPPPRADKTALKAAIKAGRNIDGIYLDRTERIEIRV